MVQYVKMGFYESSVPGDTLRLMFEVDDFNVHGFPTVYTVERPVTLLFHDQGVRINFIDLLTGDIIVAWHVGLESEDIEEGSIMYDYDYNFEGMSMRPSGGVIIFPSNEGTHYITAGARSKNTRLTAPLSEYMQQRHLPRV